MLLPDFPSLFPTAFVASRGPSAQDKAEFAYEAFNRGRDFGPLDLAATVRYCQWLDHLVPWRW